MPAPVPAPLVNDDCVGQCVADVDGEPADEDEDFECCWITSLGPESLERLSAPDTFSRDKASAISPGSCSCSGLRLRRLIKLLLFCWRLSSSGRAKRRRRGGSGPCGSTGFALSIRLGGLESIAVDAVGAETCQFVRHPATNQSNNFVTSLLAFIYMHARQSSIKP